MDKFAIQKRTNSIRAEIGEMLDEFVLNPKIKELRIELHNLQKECPHEYENGVCVYCGVKKN